ALFCTLFSLSACEKDDEAPDVNCASIQSELEAKQLEWEMIGYDCPKLEILFDEILDILNQGKNCKEIQDLAKDEGFDSVEEYIAQLENQFNAYLSDC